MSRIYRDPFSGRDVHVPSRRELIAASNLALLRDKGIDSHDVHCECCGIQLIDLGKIKFSGRVIGPECVKHPELFPCRHAKTSTVPPGIWPSRELSGLAEVEGEINRAKAL
jgi:hypothetical protein